jgi:sulfate transport system ATP-binding protein
MLAPPRLTVVGPDPGPRPADPPPSLPADVVVEDVAKAFGETAALHGVSLDVKQGELMALLGPSGSGKTTLLRILAGLDEPSRGRVLFGSVDALSLSVQQRHVGFVFQNYALFRHMSVFENIAFGLRVRSRQTRPAAADIRRRVLELLELVQLGGLDRRFPAQLSGGQRQRVALARALAIEPRLLLLDEPFGALDAKVRKELRRWLRDLHRQTGHTTVFVTHDQDEALELADRVAILREGRIEQVGTPAAIADEPASLFVYEFTGDANLLPVAINGGEALLHGEPIGLGPVTFDHGAARLAFRPADVTLVPPHEGGVTGTVMGRHRIGGIWRLEVEIDSQCHIEIALPTVTDIVDGKRIRLRPTKWRLYTDRG